MDKKLLKMSLSNIRLVLIVHTDKTFYQFSILTQLIINTCETLKFQPVKQFKKNKLLQKWKNKIFMLILYVNYRCSVITSVFTVNMQFNLPLT